MSFDEACHRLRSLLEAAVAATTADGILLSGGLDTSAVASIAVGQGRKLRAVSVAVADGKRLDEPFAQEIAGQLGIELHILRPRLADLVERMPKLIGILNTFDPMELRNSVVTYLALEHAAERRICGVLSGDAGDELFAGYSYMLRMPADQLMPYIRGLSKVMHFTSVPLGATLGVGVELPYLHHAVVDFALACGTADLVEERDGVRFGKRVLRYACSDLLPARIAWRVKTAIEFGSGSTDLGPYACESISDSEFEHAREEAAAKDGVRLRDREQYFYYRMYRGLFPAPKNQRGGVKRCAECQGPVERAEMRYCRMCGAYPI